MVNLEKRDCFARICSIKIDDKTYKTPLMINFLEKNSLIKKIDFGKVPYILEKIDKNKFEILGPKSNYFTILTGFKLLKPKELVETVIKLKTINPSKPIYTPALATPKNVLILIYLGIDVVDNILPIIQAFLGIYMLPNGEFNIESLKELPCNCKVCNSLTINELLKLDYNERSLMIAKHNTAMLESQIKLAKELIRHENLRNVLEGQSRLDTYLSAILRLCDENKSFGKFYPRFKKSKAILFKDSFTRIEIRNFFKNALKFYNPKSKALLILPCTATKPYLISQTHKKLRKKVRILVNEIIVSSPLVVPREFELLYPAINYDVPVTGIWDDDEIKFVATKLHQFIEKGSFEKIIAHVEKGYKKVVECASEIGGFDVVFTSNGDLFSRSSIEKLKKELIPYNDANFELKKYIFEHMIKYQFSLDYKLQDFYIKGKYPDLKLFVNKVPFLRIDKNYGMLDVYEGFAKVLYNKKIYSVKIDDFEPKGTIFAKGILDADINIKPNDIIIFYNSFLMGVGRSYMSGKEIAAGLNGFAIKIKRKWLLDRKS